MSSNPSPASPRWPPPTTAQQELYEKLPLLGALMRFLTSACTWAQGGAGAAAVAGIRTLAPHQEGKGSAEII